MSKPGDLVIQSREIFLRLEKCDDRGHFHCAMVEKPHGYRHAGNWVDYGNQTIVIEGVKP